MDCVTQEQINHFVLTKQHLAEKPSEQDLVQVVEDISGLHSSVATTPYLSLYARLDDFDRQQFDSLLYENPVLAKVRCVRKTLYVHSIQMMPIIFKATSTKVIKASQHFMTYRGISPEMYESLSIAILDRLMDQPMTAAELKKSLDTDADISSVLYYMCDQGLLLRGQPAAGWKDRNHKYVVLREIFPELDLDSMDEREAVTHLVRYYLAAFGPVNEADIVWWTGLGRIRVRAALRSLREEISEVKLCGSQEPMLCLESDLPPLFATELPVMPVVNFLPALDSYIMGYTNRNRFIEAKDYDYVFDSSGNATNTIVVDGVVKGVWDCWDGERAEFRTHIFGFIPPLANEQIVAQAGSLGIFLTSRAVRIKPLKEMVPLTSLPTGRMMSPLRDNH